MKQALALACILSFMLMFGCSPEVPEASSAPEQMPPAEVSVAEVLEQSIIQWQEFTGRLEAPESVELRPRVSGYIDQVRFTEGTLIAKGALLFSIDPRPFQAEVDKLEAELKSALARQKLAASDLKRAQRLRNQKAIAEEQLESRDADLEQARASVESTRATLQLARLNLSFTEVRAPISGRVSLAQVTTGNYVTAGQTVLTDIVSFDSIYAYFDADEQTFLGFQNSGRADRPAADKQVLMQLAGETDFAYQGNIDFVDNRVNPQTGTIRMRAVFDNRDNRFTPGLFARLKIGSREPSTAILISDQAIGTDLSNKYVLVLNADETLDYRKITPGPKYNDLRVVLDGLKTGEIIVVKGLQRVFPGSKVVPQFVSMNDSKTQDS